MTTNRWKNTGAVAAGFASVVLLSVGADVVMEKAGFFPAIDGSIPFSTGQLMIAFLYRSAFTVIGGVMTTRLSADDPSRQVKILGILGTLGGLAGVIFGWNLSDHWYPIALAVTAYPLTWLGGKFGTPKQ